MHAMTLPKTLLLTGAAAFVAACGGAHDTSSADAPAADAGITRAGTPVSVIDTVVPALLAASGAAEPVAQAVLATKLMGTVTAVHVREGDRVVSGQVLLEIDARDLDARESQVRAGMAAADAVHADALTQAGRIRALYADSVATKAQLDAAETGLTGAAAAQAQAHAAAAELAATMAYAVIRAPFDGVVTARFVDVGAFATPGAPLLSVQDARRLRVSVTVAPDAVRALRRGDRIEATIEDVAVQAVVEGVVPAAGGNLYTINAMVDNREGRLLAGSAATLRLPQGTRHALLVPAAAVRREGDLTGVLVRGATGDALRWVRLGASVGNRVEVLSGLRAGEQVVVPAANAATSVSN